MRQILLISVFLIILFSCGNNPKPSNTHVVIQHEQPTLPIKDFIKKFRIIQLPFYYLGWMQNESYIRQTFELKRNSIDTLFYEFRDDTPVYGYGMLADTSSFYSLIYFATADDNYPVLITYSKSGQQLSEHSLLLRGCGSDCGLKYCSNSARIDNKLSIKLSDTAHYEGMCDSAGNYSPNSDSTFIYSKTGVIDKGGIIKMGEEVEQRIKRSTR